MITPLVLVWLLTAAPFDPPIEVALGSLAIYGSATGGGGGGTAFLVDQSGHQLVTDTGNSLTAN
jgi:hypothetical protein